jgi:dolichol-phosphate mannosyltransferase
MGQLHARLREVLPALERGGRRTVEVLLFDNGSTDATRERMLALFGRERWARIHAHPANAGVGGSLRVALGLTQGSVIVGMDSDCTYDPAAIGDLLEAIDEGWDIVTGSPYHPQGRVVGVPAWRLGLSRTLSRFYRAATPVKIWTYTSMFRAYRREALEKIRWESDGFLSTSEILMLAAAEGFTIREVPATLSVRRFGASKMRLLRVIRDHLRFLIRIGLGRSFRRKLYANYRGAPDAVLAGGGRPDGQSIAGKRGVLHGTDP